MTKLRAGPGIREIVECYDAMRADEHRLLTFGGFAVRLMQAMVKGDNTGTQMREQMRKLLETFDFDRTSSADVERIVDFAGHSAMAVPALSADSAT
jgi:hypothetical protein